MIFKNNYNKRTQDLKKVAYDAGQFYWGKAETWRKEKKYLTTIHQLYLFLLGVVLTLIQKMIGN